MTSIKIRNKSNRIVCVECEGHTDFEEKGKDILCASISSIIQTALLGLLQIAAINVDFTRDEERGYLKMELPVALSEKERLYADVILGTMLLGLQDLYEGFSDFMELEVK